MCGICGVVQVGGSAREVVAPEVLHRMTAVIHHRGPDDHGTYVADGVAFGARRLSIVDVEGGHQPFSNEDGTVWAMQNGELYNHLDVRARLAADGHRFGSRCDTEILPHLYEHAGLDLPLHLRGMFGLAVWDTRLRRALIVRDRLGIKPLYWARSRDRVVFGSELKCLLASGLVGTEIDEQAVRAFLTLGFFPGEATPLRGVHKLLPGHRLVVDRDGVRTDAYWRQPEPAPAHDVSEHELREGLLDLLDESVRLRLMSDVPLGAMLSGGLDSSLIVALMARHMSRPVQTFSVGFAGTPDSELGVAREVARHFGADHHELELDPEVDDVVLEDLVWHLDEPLADLSSLGFLALSGLATKHVTVALSGQGADELLGGYARYRNVARLERWLRAPRLLRAPLGRLAPLAPARLRKPLAALAARDAGSLALVLKSNAHGAPGSLRFDGVRESLGHVRGLDRPLDRDPLASILELDAQLGLVDDMLHYFDRASMAYSLEVRVPFLDHVVVEYCATIPSALKVANGTTKHILKEAARGIVPDFVIDRPKVGFFNAAVDGWLERSLERRAGDYLASPNARYVEFLDRETVRALRERRGQGDNAQLLLSVVMLEVWLSTFVDRATQLQPPRPHVTVPA